LVEQVESQSFPKTDLLRQLRALTLDAEKCASMAQQLLNGKRQTRYNDIWHVCCVVFFLMLIQTLTEGLRV